MEEQKIFFILFREDTVKRMGQTMHIKFDKDTISIIVSVFQLFATITTVFVETLRLHFKISYKNKYSNRKQQLNKVYSQLYLLSDQYLKLSNFTYKDLETFVEKSQKIITSNNILTLPKTRRYIAVLQKDVENSCLDVYHVDRCKREIAGKYYKLRRNLHYSTDSYFTDWKSSKLYTIFFLFYTILFSLFFIVLFLKSRNLFISGNILGGLVYLGIACVALFEVCIVILKLKM